MSSADIINLSAHDLLRLYKKRDLSPLEVTKVMLERIEAVNPVINAFHYVQHDVALEAAKRSEERWAAGNPRGLLDGVPTAVKDGLLMKGIPIYRGSAANAADRIDPPSTNAPCVDRLLEHGAILLGKTTMCDYGMLASGYSSKFGPTRNPRNLEKNSGGSSSGSAAAVAAGIGPLTVGTDIVGSVRNPASFCGLVGHKPSYGRVPYHPQMSPALCAGPIARNVEDAALLLTLLALPDCRDIASLPYQEVDYTQHLQGGLKGLRVAVLDGMGFGPALDETVRKHFRTGVEVFSRAGAEMEEIPSPCDADDGRAGEGFYMVRALTEFDQHPVGVQARAEVIRTWTNPARALSASDHHRDFARTQQMRARLLEAVQGYDILVLPTVPVLPYAAENPGLDDGDTFAPWSNTFPFNLTEQPAISLPCGWSDDNLPVGLQIVGHRHDDLAVLRTAAAFEAALGLAQPRIPEQLS